MRTTSKWFIFTLVAIAQFMVVLDSAITNVALPTIKQQLHFTNSTLQWVVTAYSLTFGGFLLLGGRAADLFGRRRMLVMGMAFFTFFSLLNGISHTTSELITLRALQGLSAAFMSPSALSIVLTTFRDDSASRNKALAYWTLVATAGAALGLLLGGALTQYVGWRWNFFINVPVGIAMVILIQMFVPKHEGAEQRKGLDLLGALFVTSSLILIVLAFSQASSWGWLGAKTIGVFGAAIALLIAFLYNETRVKHPLVPLSIFKIRNVTGANAMMAPMYGVMMGLFFIVTLYLQSVLHYSPFITGLAFLPMPIILAITSTRIPGLVARYGTKPWLIVGPIMVGLGLAWLGHLPVGGHYITNLLPTLILIPIGIGMTFMPIIVSATSGVPSNEAGLASGLVNTSQMMGGSVGLSVLASIAASATTSVAPHSSSPTAALVHGFDVAIYSAIGFMVVAELLAIFVIQQKQKTAPAKTAEADGVHKLRPVVEV